MAEFDEDAHPRDKDGKFASGGGGAGLKELSSQAGAKRESALKRLVGPAPVLPALKEPPPRDPKHGQTRTWTDKIPPGILKSGSTETWHDHFTGHPDKGGQPTAERKASVHDAIVKGALDHVQPVPAGEPKYAIFTMGAPASGKSSGLRNLDKSNYVHVDPDGIKERLPEYQKSISDKGATYKGAAAMAHEESSYLAKKITGEALRTGRNVIIDGTGTSASSMAKKMEQARQAGYHVHLVMSHLDAKNGVARARQRAEEGGRYVPDAVIAAGYHSVPRNFQEISKHAATFKMVDTSREGSPSVWAKGLHGEKIYDQKFVTKFKKDHGWREHAPTLHRSGNPLEYE